MPIAPATATGPARAAGTAASTLDDYLAAVREFNPFHANRVTEPSSYDVDVSAIHDAGFERLVDLAGLAHRERKGVGVALLGDPGVGKSHLLSRVYRWANRKDEAGRARACYVYLMNVLADPDRLPRYLLKCVVSRLAEGGGGRLHESPLYRLIEGATRHALGASAFTLKDGWEAFRARFGGAASPEACQVLYQFMRHARREMADDPARRLLAAQAIAWLSGDEVDAGHAQALGLKASAHGSAQLRDDQEVIQVLLMLARLAVAAGQPFVLCVDQVDNLDDDKLMALARFLHAVIDQAENLLVIVSGVKASLLERVDREIIPASSWDRLAQYQVDVHRIRAGEARHILEARLERFHEPFRRVEAVHNHLREDTLFPLGRAWLDRRLGDGVEFRPRDVLIWARDAWDAERAKLKDEGAARWLAGWPGEPVVAKPPSIPTPAEIESAIDAEVGRKIEEQVAQRRLQPGSLPPDADNLAGLVESLLRQCGGEGLPYTFRGVERRKKQKGVLPPYDLLVREHRAGDDAEVTTGVLFVTNIGLSATTALRRLLEDESAPDHRILVTDQERRPLKVGPQGVDYYRDLGTLGPERFEHIKIGADQYATLDALEGVVQMARVGDLEVEVPRGATRPINEAEVVASHHRAGRYLAHPVLHPLLTEGPIIKGPPPPPVKLDEEDVRQYIVAQLAWQMGATARAIAEKYEGTAKAPKGESGALWPDLKKIAERMHVEGHIHAQPWDDDLLLILRA